jgi:hypothetical protein
MYLEVVKVQVRHNTCIMCFDKDGILQPAFDTLPGKDSGGISPIGLVVIFPR